MKLCLGTVQFGMDYGVQGNGKPDQEKIQSILVYAVEHGIDHFDTASAYGDAEERLGEFIKSHLGLSRDIHVVSKLAPDVFLNNNRVMWENVAEECARESISHLGVDRLSSFLFHNASYIFDQEAVKKLEAVKEKGISENIGVSVYTPEEAMKALEYDEIATIQVPYNVFDKRLDRCGFFDKAMEKEVTVYARSVLLQGLIMMGSEDIPSNLRFAIPFLKQYDDICHQYHTSKFAAAVEYVNRKNGIDYIVFGVDNIKQLEEYVSIRSDAVPQKLMDELDVMFVDAPEKLVNPVLWK